VLARALLALAPLVPAAAQDGQGDGAPDPELAQRVAGLIVERCAGCHAPGADDKRALRKWDGARDLARTRADPELLVPGDPDDSPLVFEIEDGNMPPDDSDLPAYTPEQLAELRAWIAAGAPLPEPASDGADVPTPVEPRAGPASWTQLFGRAHVGLVHFPIALLLVALLAELLRQRQAARFCLWLGALAASVASASGWINAGYGAGGDGDVDAHRWAGVATAAVAWLAVLSGEMRARGGRRLFARAYLLLLVAVAVLVSLSGHWGGQLVWGPDYLSLP
jgi:uncharacterized membrane protein